MPRNAFYAQSGGVTSVINASACGVIERASQAKEIGKVYAGLNGILGALREDLIDTSKETKAAIRQLRMTPSGAFGSCRYKLKSPESHPREYERILNVFRAHDIGYFFYNGGGDSQDTANKLAQYSQKQGFPITCIGIPKTVDNDLPLTDTCPGFGSVAKYVAISTLEAALDVRSMAETSTKVFVLEVMGRHAGWIAAAGGLIKNKPSDPPHVIVFPEIAFDPIVFVNKVKSVIAKEGYCVVVASEGAQTAEGCFLAESGVSDAFGHVQLGGVAPFLVDLIKRELGLKCHWALADYLQRAARHIASKTDVEQAYAVGASAVESAIAGHNAMMVAIERLSNAPYRWKTSLVPLHKVANVERKMPRRFISKDGFGITQAAKTYLEPLIHGEDYPAYKSGLPQYATLKRVLVPKKLASAGF